MVSSHVSLESRLLLETGSASFTFERSILDVDYFVRVEISHFCEAFAAVAALERLLAGMRENVSSEIEASIEHF